MCNETFKILETSVEKAKEELNYAIYLEENGGNAGIRKINSNKVDWLKWVVYLAELGLVCEKHLSESAVAPPEEPQTDFEKARMLFQMIKDNSIE